MPHSIRVSGGLYLIALSMRLHRARISSVWSPRAYATGMGACTSSRMPRLLADGQRSSTASCSRLPRSSSTALIAMDSARVRCTKSSTSRSVRAASIAMRLSVSS
ncbi:hypothetical protein D3C72_2246800 [compost metagenome]